MRATRAYLASLGTTGLLVLSSVLLLVLGSALVTFDGWPGGSDSDEPESVVVQAAPIERDPDTGPEGVAAAAAPAAEAVAAAAPVQVAEAPDTTVPDDGGDDGDSGTPEPPDGIDVTPPAPGPGAPSDPTDTPPGSDPDPGRPGGVPLPGGGRLLPPGDVTLVDGLADGVESTTTYLGQDVVSQLSPGLGTLLTQAGQGLTDLVRALDGTPAPPRR